MAAQNAQEVASLIAKFGGDASDFKRVAGEVLTELGKIQTQIQQTGKQSGNIFSGMLGANLAMGALNQVTGAIGNVASSIVDVTKAGFNSIVAYETMNRTLTQLTATQLVQSGVTTDMSQALKLAVGPAQDLYRWIEQLAISSPFKGDTIAAAVRLAQAFGLTQGEAKRLTKDLIDFSAGAGLTEEGVNRITLSLGQMMSRGKMTGEQIRELSSAGLPIVAILSKELGKAPSEILKMSEAGAISAVTALRAVESYLEKNFKGSAERAQNTWQGLLTSLDTIKQRDLRAVFSGIFSAIQPEAIKIVNWLGSDSFYGQLSKVGQGLGEGVKTSIAIIKQTLAGFTTEGGPLAGMKDLFSPEKINAQGISKALAGVTADLIAAGASVLLFGQEFVMVIQMIIEEVNRLKSTWDNSIFGRIGNAVEGAKKWGEDTQKMLIESGQLHPSTKPGYRNPYAQYANGEQREGWVEPTNWQKRFEEAQKQRDDAVREAYAARDKAVSASAAKFDAQGNVRKDFFSNLWNPAANFPQQPGGNAAVQNALNAPPAIEGALNKGGEKLAQKIESAFEKAAGNVSKMLLDATGAAKGLADLTGAGGKSPTEPGGNGPFERLFRVIDIAKNAGAGLPDTEGRMVTEPHGTRQIWEAPRQTQEWMRKEGLNQQQALEIGKQFELGNYFAPGVFERIDWKRLGELSIQQEQQQKMATYAGQAVVGLQAAGKELTPENVKAMVDQLAAADKDTVVPNLQQIRDAVKSMGEDTSSILKDILTALGGMPSEKSVPSPVVPVTTISARPREGRAPADVQQARALLSPAMETRAPMDLATARALSSQQVSGTILAPVSGKITQSFGEYPNQYANDKRGHMGVDIAVPVGTAVQAPISGIAQLQNDPKGFGQSVVIVNKELNETVRLAHLSAQSVKEGQQVTAGQIVGQSGNTGFSTGPHLHLAMTKAGEQVNPQFAGQPAPSDAKQMSLWDIIQNTFPKDQWNNALKVVMRESGGKPDAINNTAYPDLPDYRGKPGPKALPEYSGGLFQINVGPGAHKGLAPEKLTDPLENAKYAAKLYGEQGWSPWKTTEGETVPPGEVTQDMIDRAKSIKFDVGGDAIESITSSVVALDTNSQQSALNIIASVDALGTRIGGGGWNGPTPPGDKKPPEVKPPTGPVKPPGGGPEEGTGFTVLGLPPAPKPVDVGVPEDPKKKLGDNPLAGIFGVPTYPHHAGGSQFTMGGPTLVGEGGPEILDLPRGGRIWSNTQVQQAADRGGSGSSDIVRSFQALLSSVTSARGEEAGRELGQVLIYAAANHVQRGLLASLSR